MNHSLRFGLWAGYDWGTETLNMARWNSSQPPLYSYDKITSPVALFWADNDILVVPQDVQTLAKQLPNLVRGAHFRLHLQFINEISLVTLVES